MNSFLQQFSSDFSEFFNPPSYSLKTESLRDLHHFGKQALDSANAEVTFRWPTSEDLKQLELNEPLKLQAIRTKGALDNPLSAIQLVFQNGIESPIFDSQKKGADDFTTVALPDGSPIVSITSKASNIGCSDIVFVQKNGQETVIFDKNWHYGSEEIREIPETHAIVGVYGLYNR